MFCWLRPESHAAFSWLHLRIQFLRHFFSTSTDFSRKLPRQVGESFREGNNCFLHNRLNQLIEGDCRVGAHLTLDRGPTVLSQAAGLGGLGGGLHHELTDLINVKLERFRLGQVGPRYVEEPILLLAPAVPPSPIHRTSTASEVTIRIKIVCENAQNTVVTDSSNPGNKRRHRHRFDRHGRVFYFCFLQSKERQKQFKNLSKYKNYTIF